MADTTAIQKDYDEALGLTFWTDPQSQIVSIGLEASWYTRTVVSLPQELSERELGQQIHAELKMQFPLEPAGFLFDYVALSDTPPLDGLRAWDVFSLAAKHLPELTAWCAQRCLRLGCVVPVDRMHSAMGASEVCFYPSREHRRRHLWRKRTVRACVCGAAGMVLSLGLGSGLAWASMRWSHPPVFSDALAQVQQSLESSAKEHQEMETLLAQVDASAHRIDAKASGDPKQLKGEACRQSLLPH